MSPLLKLVGLNNYSANSGFKQVAYNENDVLSE